MCAYVGPVHMLALGVRREEPELGPRLLPQRVKSSLGCAGVRCRCSRGWSRLLPSEAAPLHGRAEQHGGLQGRVSLSGAQNLCVDARAKMAARSQVQKQQGGRHEPLG